MQPLVVCSLCVCLAAPALATAQPLTFDKTDYPATTGGRAIVVADLNRDGWLDVAEGSLNGSVAVLLNQHGQRLVSSGSVPVGAGAFEMAAGDFNRDGIADLVVANADGNSLSVLLGRGDGRFARSDIATDVSPRGVTTGDFNKDGILDIAYTAYVSGTVNVWLGDGRGGFSRAWRLPSAAQPQAVTAADVDHDGHAELVVACNGRDGLVLWHEAAGAYASRAIAGESFLNLVVAADLNGDGWMDVVAASTDRNRVAVYRGGASGLVFDRSYAVDGDPRGLTVADVNGDSTPDVITANRATSTVTILPGDPAHRGTFLARLTVAAGWSSRAVAAADLTGDGRVDLVTGNQYAATVSLLTNATVQPRAAASFDRVTVAAPVSVSRYRETLSSGASLGVADFNRDGTLDVAAHVTGDGAVAVVLRDSRTVVLSGPHPYAGHVVDDFNDDGNADVLYFASTEATGTRFVTYLGNGRGAFVSSLVSTVAGRALTACVSGDLNRDRRPDLACVEDLYRGGALVVLLGTGDGRFVLQVFSGGSGMDPQILDVNRDGRLDVVLGQTGQIWLGDGRGGFAPGRGIDIGVNTGWRIRLADLDHDGYLDLVSSYNGESLYVALGGADGFVNPPIAALLDCECDFSFVVADVNADGNLDVIANSVEATEFAGKMFIFAGHGDGTFGVDDGRFRGAEVFAMVPGEMLVGDVTGDGLPDVVVPGGRAFDVLANRRSDSNRPPVIGSHVADLTIAYDTWQEHCGCIDFPVQAADPDQQALWVTWQVSPEYPPAWAWPSGLVGRLNGATACFDQPGSYRFDLVVDDAHRATARRTVANIVVLPPN